MASGHNIQTPQSGMARRRSQSDFLPAAMRAVWVMIIFSAMLTAVFALYPEWIRLSDMKRDLAKQRDHLEDLQKLTIAHEEEIHLLQTDRDYLETIARDRLDMMKEGETIFRLGSSSHSHS